MRPRPDSMRYTVAAAWLILCVVAALLAINAPRVEAAPTFTFQCADPSGATTTRCEVLYGFDIHGGVKGTVAYGASGPVKATIPQPAAPRVAVVAMAKTSTGTNTAVLVMQTAPAGCASGWAPVGYQSWWSDTGQDPYFGSRHAHIDNLCWPVNNKIITAPTVALDVPMQLHNQPPGSKLTRVRGWSSAGGDFWVCTPGKAGTNGCPSPWPTIDANGSLHATFRATIPFSSMSNGRHEFRWGVYVTQPDGKVQLLSSRSQVCDGSCSPAFRSGTYQGNGGWYANDSPIGYVDARIHSAFPVAP